VPPLLFLKSLSVKFSAQKYLSAYEGIYLWSHTKQLSKTSNVYPFVSAVSAVNRPTTCLKHSLFMELLTSVDKNKLYIKSQLPYFRNPLEPVVEVNELSRCIGMLCYAAEKERD
jgi:hypothetical protein